MHIDHSTHRSSLNLVGMGFPQYMCTGRAPIIGRPWRERFYVWLNNFPEHCSLRSVGFHNEQPIYQIIAQRFVLYPPEAYEWGLRGIKGLFIAACFRCIPI